MTTVTALMATILPCASSMVLGVQNPQNVSLKVILSMKCIKILNNGMPQPWLVCQHWNRFGNDGQILYIYTQGIIKECKYDKKTNCVGVLADNITHYILFNRKCLLNCPVWF